LPDLLVFQPDHSGFWFAEVKGPGDRLRASQQESHEAIRRCLGVAVALITVRLHPGSGQPAQPSRADKPDL